MVAAHLAGATFTTRRIAIERKGDAIEQRGLACTGRPRNQEQCPRGQAGEIHLFATRKGTEGLHGQLDRLHAWRASCSRRSTSVWSVCMAASSIGQPLTSA
ncbi:hypothetical protein SDC9_187127 [bioreactor metagenome]|uniref:Uncharacterized protein n=1 Tax=bioreactor metagenome TaxID=1076179 RepID=A0A645HMX4_9ZZZZ